MMRKRMMGTAVVVLSLLLAGCGEKQEEEVKESVVTETNEQAGNLYLSQLKTEGIVELGEYKGIAVKKQSTEVPESMVDDYLEYTMSFQGELKPVPDRDVVEEGDTVNIDYEGKKDGIAFEGGTAAGANLEIGSGSFIAGFEEGLIGVKKGETVDLNLTFPEDYPAEDLAGAEVVFTVTVNEIQTLTIPVLDDTFVKNLGIEGVETVSAYRDSVREMLEEQMEAEAEYQLQVSVIEAAMANSTIQEPSEELKKKYTDVAIRQTEKEAEFYGMDMATYVLANYGVDVATYEANIEAGANEAAKQALLCKAIAEAEGILITDEVLNKTVEENYDDLGYSSVEEFKAANDLEEYRDSLLLEQVLDFLIENAEVTENAQVTKETGGTEEDHAGHDHD